MKFTFSTAPKIFLTFVNLFRNEIERKLLFASYSKFIEKNSQFVEVNLEMNNAILF